MPKQYSGAGNRSWELKTHLSKKRGEFAFRAKQADITACVPKRPRATHKRTCKSSRHTRNTSRRRITYRYSWCKRNHPEAQRCSMPYCMNGNIFLENLKGRSTSAIIAYLRRKRRGCTELLYGAGSIEKAKRKKKLAFQNSYMRGRRIKGIGAEPFYLWLLRKSGVAL